MRIFPAFDNNKENSCKLASLVHCCCGLFNVNLALNYSVTNGGGNGDGGSRYVNVSTAATLYEGMKTITAI